MTKRMMVVPREGERTFAVVTWKATTSSFPTGVPANKLCVAIIAAVTEWVMTTEDGKKAWENSSNDFNIGDLSANLSDDPTDPLNVLLAKQGITGLEITTYNDTDGDLDWTYDTVLVDEIKLSEDDD